MLRNTVTTAKAIHTPITFNYIGLIAIWSTTPLAVVLSVRDMHPIWALAARLLLALCIGLIILMALRMPLPKTLAAIKIYAIASLGLFWAMLFTYFGARYLPSGLVSLLFGLAPIVTGMAAYGLNKNKQLSINQWIGMLIAVVGLAIIVGEIKSSEHMLRGVLFILLGVVLYVASLLGLQQQKTTLHPLQQTVGSLAVSLLCLACILPAFWLQAPNHMPEQLVILAIVYSAVVATIIAMGMYFYLAQMINPTSLALTTVITPIFALMWGKLFNHESMPPAAYAGMAVVLMGLMLYVYGNQRK